MSTPTPSQPVAPPKSKARKSKDKDKDKDKERDGDHKEKTLLPGERLKIVVRKLPPNLPEDIFWQSVSNWVTDESVSWRSYCPGKPQKRPNKEYVPSRAYIAFKTPEQILTFSREYDGHKFVDKAGNESYAVVEYAPYQKIPGEKKKPDSRHATIEKDEDYISFIESLNAPSATEPISLETLIASTRPVSPPKTTPLLEALRAEKQAQKDKEAIIRNHPHYKDLLNGPSQTTSRREGKGKAGRAGAAAAAGKKGKKGAAAGPSPSKPIQIQAKPNVAGPSNNDKNPPTPAPLAKPQPSPARPSRKHATKSSKEAVQPPTNAAATTPSPKDAPKPPVTPKAVALVPTPAQEPTPNVATPSRRGRPVLGLGSRHFEAALNGAGVTGERKRREKGKEAALIARIPSQENAPQDKPNPPTSPKRSRQRKDGPTPTGPIAGPASTANGTNAIVTPSVQPDGGGRGGKRGGRGGGRGRGGPPRIG